MDAKTRPTLTATLFAALLVLAGCNATDLERAAIGAGVGGATTAVVGGNVGTGILLGAAAGALCDDADLC
jgi:osmotically inducible lipoprotein OsmB